MQAHPSHAPPRQLSVPRPPPMLPPGMPIKADNVKVSHHPRAPSQQRMSMPVPSTAPGPPRSAQGHHLPRPPRSNSSSVTSRPSPAMSSGTDDSLRESKRVNMPHPRAYRQDSGRSAREENLKTPREQWLETPQTPSASRMGGMNDLDSQFDQLLDSLQVSSSVRRKINVVSSDIKSSILNSTLSANPTILSSLGLPSPAPNETPKVKKRLSTPMLRKVKSSGSLGSPGPNPEVGKTYMVAGDQFTIVASPLASPNPMSPPKHTQRMSTDLSRPAKARHMSTGPARPLSLFASSSSGSVQSFGRAGGKGLNIAMGERPDAFIAWLSAYKATDLKMDVARCKKLRMLLRHESTAWVDAFINGGGYKLVLARLQDLLDVEWREEQHDDQMLYELLRCIKALFTSEIGKSALRSSYPQPFPALSTLLFSEKKPGDLACRQIIIELWLSLFELFPATASSARPSSIRFDGATDVKAGVLDPGKDVRGLLAPEQEDKTKDQHEFITQAHRPKPFKAWVGELSDICRDYFWCVNSSCTRVGTNHVRVFCHGSSTLWALDEVDPALVERPVAPGGATGGVEFEAMNYVVTHFRLLNALCENLAAQSPRLAGQLHYDLFASGMDRILVTLRKASTTYYPTLHLELARYVYQLRTASPSGRLPSLIEKLVGSPPEEVRRRTASKAEYLPDPFAVQGGSGRGTWDMQS
ncbi:armadillo-type protein [Naematelia encephala]|uniref:Armadillo-type protein n=1 Tax=Naematelia encephala TaxID=71784 RepID=A0A1Y2ALP2_9TREE|nr:armadillo-type protein [Naematelia encephala]